MPQSNEDLKRDTRASADPTIVLGRPVAKSISFSSSISQSPAVGLIKKKKWKAKKKKRVGVRMERVVAPNGRSYIRIGSSATI
jgi:hypothetical protein